MGAASPGSSQRFKASAPVGAPVKVKVGGRTRDIRAVSMDARGRVVMIDQRALPHKLALVRAQSPDEVARAIKNMTIRGAPSIGAAAAYGLAQARMKRRSVGRAAHPSPRHSSRCSARESYHGTNHAPSEALIRRPTSFSSTTNHALRDKSPGRRHPSPWTNQLAYRSCRGHRLDRTHAHRISYPRTLPSPSASRHLVRGLYGWNPENGMSGVRERSYKPCYADGI